LFGSRPGVVTIGGGLRGDIGGDIEGGEGDVFMRKKRLEEAQDEHLDAIGATLQRVGQMAEGSFPAERLDPANIDYASLAPEHIADAIIHVINQPWGVSISDITVRGAGDHFIL
jgi:hypothetical protein